MDVIAARPEFITPLKKAGLLAKYDSPERRYYPDNLKDKEGYWTAYFLNLNTPGYNTRLVSPNELPRTYEEMLHPPRLKKGLKWYVADPEEGGDYAEIVSLYRKTFGLR